MNVRPSPFFELRRRNVWRAAVLYAGASARAMLERLAGVLNPSAAARGRELTDAIAGHGDRHALALRYAGSAASRDLSKWSRR